MIQIDFNFERFSQINHDSKNSFSTDEGNGFYFGFIIFDVTAFTLLMAIHSN